MAMISDNDAQFGGKMRGVSLLLVLLASSAGIDAESTEPLKIVDHSSTLKSDSTNSATQHIQVSSLEGSSNDASNNTNTTSSLEQKPVETTLRNVTPGENGVDSVTTSSLSPKENVLETPERNIQSDSPQENGVGETNTGTDTNLGSSGHVPTKLPALVSNSTITSVKSPLTTTDSENATLSNVISPLTTVTINRNDTSSGTFENKTVPNSLTTVPHKLNVSSANETTGLTNSDAQQNPTVSNLTSLTNGTEEVSPDNSTHSNNEVQTFDVPDGGNTADNTSTEYPATSSLANTTSENETISTLTISNSTEIPTTSVESSENSTLAASVTSLNATDNTESAVDRNTTLSSNTTEILTSDNPNSTVTSNYTDSTNETVGSTTTSSDEIATVTYSPSDNDTMSSIPTPPSMETTVSYPQNSTLLEPTTPVSITNDTEVYDNITDPPISSTHVPTSEIPLINTTDGMENTTYPPSTTTGSETTVSSNSSSESTEHTATSSTTSSDPTTKDLSSDVPSTGSNNTTTVELTTSVESSEDTTSTEPTTDTKSVESSTEETSSVMTSTTEVPGTSSTTYYTTSTTEVTNLPTTITKPPTTRTTTVTSQISTTTENASNNLGPPLNHFSVTDKNGVACIIFRVRLELIISYATNSGAISDERLNVPSVDKFEGACGFVEQYITATWSIPTGGTNNISFSMEKSIDNSSYTLKVIRVSLVLDKVNFPDARHQGVTLSEEIGPNFYSIPSGRGLKCATRKSFVGTNVTMIASDVELVAFNEQEDLSALQYGGCPLAAAPTLQTEEIAAIAVGAVLALITASLATALVFRKRRTRTNKFYLTGNTWA